MRPFGILVDQAMKLREPSIPSDRQARVNPPPLRLLDDAVTEAFNQACIAGDLEAAADLLALVEKWHSRRSYSGEQARRTDRIFAKRMQGELERRHIIRGTRPPAPAK
jgi:hypothetical protein